MNSRPIFKFRLYIAGEAQNSLQALANLRAICRAHASDRHDIEIVDVQRAPRRALQDGIFMTPTLVKLAPGPVQRIVGTLSNVQVVREVCGMGEVAA